jgi:hypothetical protein
VISCFPLAVFRSVLTFFHAQGPAVPCQFAPVLQSHWMQEFSVARVSSMQHSKVRAVTGHRAPEVSFTPELNQAGEVSRSGWSQYPLHGDLWGQSCVHHMWPLLTSFWNSQPAAGAVCIRAANRSSGRALHVPPSSQDQQWLQGLLEKPGI